MAVTMSAAEPAGSRQAVVFACDGNYTRYALFAADQIARLHPGRDFDICICAMAETLQPLPGLEGFRYCRIETGGMFRGLNLDARRTEAAYLRLALPAAFAADYDRLLYLDSDIFVQGGDFAALMRSELGGHAVAAVRDNMQWRTPGRVPEQFRRLGMPAAPYFNSGLLLIDVPAFNAADLMQRCLDFARAHEGRMIGHDQNLLNCVLRGDWAELHPAWNWQYTGASRLFEALEGANIVHFIGATKPWRDEKGRLPRRFRDGLAAFLAAHFPNAALEPAPPRPLTDRAFLRKMLFRHLVATGRFCDYLDRFESETTVLTRRA
jgi:lipopolysaccharide biosynthesis glycosyltransferase